MSTGLELTPVLAISVSFWPVFAPFFIFVAAVALGLVAAAVAILVSNSGE